MSMKKTHKEQNKVACEIISRIHFAFGIKEERGSLKELAPLLRVKSGSIISGWKSRDTGVPEDKIARASLETGYIENWIKTGEGPMRNEQSVGDGVQIGDSIEDEVRRSRVMVEGQTDMKYIREAINHLKFISETDTNEFNKLRRIIKRHYDLIYDENQQSESCK